MRSERLFALTSIFLLLTISSAYAADVALVVKDASSLSSEHESRINQILNYMGHQVTLIDKYSSVNYQDFDLIVIAGRPDNTNPLDNFVASIPVNDIPTIAIDYSYLESWGWVSPSGKHSLISSQPHSVRIREEHKITEGFAVDQKVYVHSVQGLKLVYMNDRYTDFHSVASSDSFGSKVVIGYARPGTELKNGQRISEDSCAVFFGVSSPLYWTGEAEQLFTNAIDWLTVDSDGDFVKDCMDNCHNIRNQDQADRDSDGIGDACDTEDNRPDLTITQVTANTICNSLVVTIKVKNIGFDTADSYDVMLQMDGLEYTKTDGPLNVNQEDTITFDIPEQNACGWSYINFLITILNVNPSDMNPNNNNATYTIYFERINFDIDNDGTKEYVKDDDGIYNGYEKYYDPNSNTAYIQTDGDSDSKFDYIIDIGKNGVYEKYWDPDDNVITNVKYNNTDILIDTDGDGYYDKYYSQSDGQVHYIETNPPVIGSITVNPDWSGKTWIRFNISASVSDAESGIAQDSCEYTINRISWLPAQYENGKCKVALTASIGNELKINMRVKDKAGNSATGNEIIRTVAKMPLTVTITLDKSSYSLNDSVKVNGSVASPDGSRIAGAHVYYSITDLNVNSTTNTNSNGYYSFSFNATKYGTFTLNIKAEAEYAEGSSSTTINVPSGYSGNGSGTAIIMIVDAPNSLTVNAGDTLQFNVRVKNEGEVKLNWVKINANLPGLSFAIAPDKVDLLPGQYQDFTIRTDIPGSMQGEYIIDMDVLSYEKNTNRKIYLTVLEKPVVFPVIELIEIQLPELYYNKSSIINVVYKNSGNTSAYFDSIIKMPEDWTAEQERISMNIDANSIKTVAFAVVPSKISGRIEITTSYTALGNTIEFTNSTQVYVNVETKELGITGYLVLLMNPWFYGVATILVASSLLIVFRNRIFFPERFLERSSRIARRISKPSRPRTVSGSYDAWERKYRRG